MKDINFIEIIKKGWKTVWENKYLWWFGLFLALGTGPNFNFNLPLRDEIDKQISGKEEISIKLLEQYWQLFVVLAILSVLLLVAIFVFRILSQSGMVKELDRIEKNDKGSFRRGMVDGKRYFWKLFLVEMIVGVLIIGVAVVLGVPIAFLFYLKSYIFAFLSSFLAILIFIPVLVIVSFSRKYAIFYLILADLGIKESLEKGYCLFRKNILESIVMSLVFIPISIALIFSVMIVALSLAVMFLVLGIILYLFLLKTGMVITIVLGFTAFIFCLIVISSVYQSFYQSVWYLFFKKIATVKENNKIEECVENKEDMIEKRLPSPGEA